ncbi:ribosomal RNA small subunit methyltransferase B [Salinisphaera sp. PC39]|uniref:16S rRNA (cytosine(967)-C(5))-methyltransferase RsmB n=1 Tax=Salinisphaera sp. PC39 TaxID=1304156 RepID=UPI00333F2994
MAAEGVEPRVAAARAVAAVFRGRSLDAALAAERAALHTAPDRALAAALAYGVLRDRRALEAIAGRLWRKPPKPVVAALILAGLYQLRSMRVPAHAAVHATVDAAGPLGQPRARGLVNALLRRYQREAETLEAAADGPPAVRESYPDWLVERLRADWPDRWRELLAAGNRPAPMTLRVNRRQTTPDAYRERLDAAGIRAAPHPAAPDALVLERPCPVEDLPGFGAGHVSVQDAAAQLAVPLLDIQSGMRVLDACAAPGGKAAHCLERIDCELLALDSDGQRLAAVRETFDRLGLRGETREADATRPDDWWDGRPFDRILLDAPCTGTGVIRRHPDIKWLRRETDVAALATRQRALLEALWPLLAPGGVLVYATCSVLRAEGADTVAAFLADTEDAAEEAIAADWGEGDTLGRRIATGEADMDGFYYARLVKT